MPESNVPFGPNQYNTAPAPSPANTAAYLAAVTMTDTEWDAHQEARYPGTQEIIDARRGLLAEIETFAAPDAPASRLFEHFDPALADEADPIKRLYAYEALCVEHFDFRIGPDGKPRERQEIPHILKQSREEVGEELWDLAFEVADAEGMVGDTELDDNDHVKAIGVLGGTENAMDNRTKYALEQIDVHGATVDSFDFLVAEGKETEWALKEAQAKLGAKIGEEDIVSVVKNEKGVVTTLAPVEVAGRMVPVRIMTAAARDGRTRATTLETMALWGELTDAQADDHMVAVTTGMYVGFQNANAREVITWKTGTVIDVIGHSADWAGMDRYANQLLQEYKATVDSRHRLYEKMIETGLVPA